MRRLSRLKPNDKVEIIDSSSPDFSKTGEVIHIWSRPTTMISSGSKPIRSGSKICCQVKLDDAGTMTEFYVGQIRKIQ
jgi:hypothetical protein